jgi:hypothetical protein
MKIKIKYRNITKDIKKITFFAGFLYYTKNNYKLDKDL